MIWYIIVYCILGAVWSLYGNIYIKNKLLGKLLIPGSLMVIPFVLIVLYLIELYHEKTRIKNE